jgi:hypothetical protein
MTWIDEDDCSAHLRICVRILSYFSKMSSRAREEPKGGDQRASSDEHPIKSRRSFTVAPREMNPACKLASKSREIS